MTPDKILRVIVATPFRFQDILTALGDISPGEGGSSNPPVEAFFNAILAGDPISPLLQLRGYIPVRDHLAGCVLALRLNNEHRSSPFQIIVSLIIYSFVCVSTL